MAEGSRSEILTVTDYQLVEFLKAYKEARGILEDYESKTFLPIQMNEGGKNG